MDNIRKMKPEDKETILRMMWDFYHSDAVHTNGSEEIYAADVDACISENPYLEGYVFTDEDTLQGYAMVAKSFATEFGKPCIWIEDLYLLPQYRGMGIGSRFLKYIGECYPYAILRLEAEEENHHAVHVYKKAGFTVLPYMELKKESLL